jgi:hypothetical protein
VSTVVCLASGPSLTPEDCALVEQSGHRTFAVNNTWEMARFCHVIYAGDLKWWSQYNDVIDIGADRWTCNRVASELFGINWHRISSSNFNSGQRAIQFAIEKGAKRVILLGYDCQLTGGKTHHHGDHVEGLQNPNAQKMVKWSLQFSLINTRGTEVINCSRETSLDCFPRKPLEECL